MSRRPKPEYDCSTCGACCVSDVAWTPFVDLVQADLERLKEGLGARRARRLTVLEHDGHSQMAVKVDRQGHHVCAAHRGRVGASSRCSAYESRPGACRAFEPGGESCLAARERFESESGIALEPPRRPA